MTAISRPTTDQVRIARHAAGMTQAQAAKLVHLRAGGRWAEYEQGKRNIDLARWELFLIKTGQRAVITPEGA